MKSWSAGEIFQESWGIGNKLERVDDRQYKAWIFGMWGKGMGYWMSVGKLKYDKKYSNLNKLTIQPLMMGVLRRWELADVFSAVLRIGLRTPEVLYNDTIQALTTPHPPNPDLD